MKWYNFSKGGGVPANQIKTRLITTDNIYLCVDIASTLMILSISKIFLLVSHFGRLNVFCFVDILVSPSKILHPISRNTYS